MIIIFGSKVRYKTLSTGQFYCPQCKARRDYELRQARNWFSVYFIPVIPLNQIGELVTCLTCGTNFAKDVLSLPIPGGTRVPIVRPHPEAPTASDIRAVLHFLAAAERPVIIAGAGVLRARCSNDLVRFAELLHVPVIASWRRGDIIPNDHPLYLGMSGIESPATVRARLEAADAVLVLGSRLSEPTSYRYAIPADGQPWMHVDLEPRTTALGATAAPVLAI